MPPSPSPPSKPSPDDNVSRLSEAALRKKKNADAQAAFRARRANYIATLEQTVTNLETVVLQLQDSCKEARSQNEALQREVERWKQNARQAERTARKLWQAQQRSGMISNGQSHEYSTSHSVHPQSAVSAAPMSPSLVAHYGDNGMRYSSGDQSVSLAGAFHHSGIGQDVQQRSPTTYSSAVGTDMTGDGRSQHMESQRMHRYDQYYPPMTATSHDGTWAHANGQTSVSPSDVLDSGSSSHSPSYVESPTLTSPELGYPQYGVDEKTDILDSPSYMFADSRSISPAVSTPTSTSSTSSVAATPFQFTFQSDSMVQDRTEFGYRRSAPGPQLTLHGGTADISVATARRDPSRYTVAPRLTNPLTDRPITQALAAYSRSENGSGGRDRDSDNESSSYGYPRSRQRSEAPSAQGSRSPSPVPPICGTLAVIKAQAFGALRRTRTKGKKTTESAARAAVEALEARGIEMGIAVGSKRPRLHDDGEGQT